MRKSEAVSHRTDKPNFLFRGLSYLYHIENCRIIPVGYDRQGVKYFEVVDVIENKQFFTAEITALDEDVVFKDKYGIVRFCVHGWGEMSQLDVYINIKKPVGIIKHKIFYNHNLQPLFKAELTNMGAFGCFGPPTYKISSLYDGKLVGYVTPEPASIHAQFDQFLDEGPKALIVSFCLQLALAKYQMLNLNLQKVKYIYKDRAKAKARKESERQKKLSQQIGPSGQGQSQVVPILVPQPIVMVPAGPAAEQMALEQQRRASAASAGQTHPVASDPPPQQGQGSQPQVIVVQLPPQQQPAVPAQGSAPTVQVFVSNQQPDQQGSGQTPQITELFSQPKLASTPDTGKIEDSQASKKKDSKTSKSSKDKEPLEIIELDTSAQADRRATLTAGPGGESALANVRVLHSHTTPSYLWDESYYGRKHEKNIDPRGGIPSNYFNSKSPSAPKTAVIPDSMKSMGRQPLPSQQPEPPVTKSGSNKPIRAALQSDIAESDYKSKSSLDSVEKKPLNKEGSVHGEDKPHSKEETAQAKEGKPKEPHAKKHHHPHAKGPEANKGSSSTLKESHKPLQSGWTGPQANAFGLDSNKGSTEKDSRKNLHSHSAVVKNHNTDSKHDAKTKGGHHPTHPVKTGGGDQVKKGPESATNKAASKQPQHHNLESQSKRGSDQSDDRTIIELDSSFHSDKEAPNRTSDTKLMPATPTLDRHSKVHGSQSHSQTIKKGQDGVKLIQSQKSIAHEEILNPDGTRMSMCHVSCEKRVSMTETQRKASIARRMSQTDPDNAVAQAILQRQSVPTTTGTVGFNLPANRNISKDLGVRRQSRYDEARQSVFVGNMGVKDSVTTKAEVELEEDAVRSRRHLDEVSGKQDSNESKK